MKTSGWISLACVTLVFPAHATTVTVPAEQPTIQTGLNACMPGDTVLVAPGTYLENIVWPTTQNLCLLSEAGRDVTIIDGSNPSNPDSGSVVLFVTGLDEGTVLRGFTITGGTGTLDVDPPYAYYGGGGIFCAGSSPTIADNLITGNTTSEAGGAGGCGGGIECAWGASPLIESNRIEGNAVSGQPPNYSTGAGIDCYLSSPTIRANVISGNTTPHVGGGLRIGHDCFPTVTGNEITDNYAGIDGGGIQIAYNSAPVVTHNWIRGNAANYGGGIACYDPSVPTDPYFAYNVISANGAAVGGGGIHCSDSSTPIIEHCAIYANVGGGVLCEGGSNPEIRYSDIFDHGPYVGVRNNTPSLTLDVENNWWGHSSGPYHPATNPDGLGDEVSDFVDYEPWSIISVGVGEAMAQPPPAQFVLRQNRPNPFNPVTMIEFSLPRSSQVVLRVYDVLGREIVTLVDEVKAVGTHRTSWDASNVASGVYFYRIEADGWTATRSMVLAR